MKTLITYYRQFKNVDIKQLLPNHLSVEMTLLMSMPNDLEQLVNQAVNNGLEDEDCLEDAYVKIQSYRMMFGITSAFKQNLSFEPSII